MTQGSAPSPADTYLYNGDGLRMSKTVSGNTTVFSWNTVGGQPVVLSAGSTDYIYGPLGTPVEQVNGGTGGVAQYLVSDDIGSTRLILNEDGSMAQALSYLPYGKVSTPSSTVKTPIKLATSILFAGGYQDNETGFLYLVNRYYDPATGVFVSVDPMVAVTGEAYSYAGNEPVNVIDPLGLSWWNPSTWSEKTWVGIGVGLGAVALAATGVGLVVDGTVLTFAAGSVAFAAGTGAVAIDRGPCMRGHDSAACVGMVMGGVGALVGGAATGADLLGAADLANLYGIGSLGFGGVGLGVDSTSYIEWLTGASRVAC